MAWKKPTAELAALLDGALAPFDCQKKIMFGFPAYFVHGQMFAGLHQDSLILRLAEADRADLLATWQGASQFEPMEGRPMREYVTVPASLYQSPTVFSEWLDRAYGYASSLPPKAAKPAKAKAK
jgi:TfoX/Sxy family transcriptional regulator of competence genes